MKTREKILERMKSVAGEAQPGALRPALCVCGINHTRAGIGLLEHYALSPERAHEVLKETIAKTGATQALVLSTCNRTEIYAWGTNADLPSRLRDLFVSLGGDAAAKGEIIPLYEYRGFEAARHLFAVESGLDSMILGENYIKQQVRQAYEMSQSEGAAGPELHLLLQAALRCGKRIRTETELNVGTLESDIAAILKAEQVLGTLAGKVCMVIGAGKIGRRAARAIAERMPARLLIVNRTIETAQEIAGECCGEAHGLGDLPELLPLADFILGAAFAPDFVIRHPAYVEAIRRRAAPGKVCMVDTAMPRILDPDLALLPMVELFDLEHMQEIVESNRSRRESAAKEAWRIVEEEIVRFRAAQRQADLAPTIAHLKGEFDRIFEEERAALEKLAAGEGSHEKLEAVQHRIKQRLLHEVIEEFKAASGRG